MTLWIFLIAALLLSLAIWLIALNSLWGFLAVRVPLVFTSSKDFRELHKHLRLSTRTVFYELGSGLGKNVFLTERLTGAVVTGFEFLLWAHALASLRKWLMGSKATFRRTNFFKTSWALADVLYCYLLPEIMPFVAQKFLAEGKPGSKLVSYDFAAKNLTPSETLRMPSGHTFYIYQK
jgi:hypothetical protein